MDPTLHSPGELLADALGRGDLDGAAAVIAGHLWPLVRTDWPLLARVLQLVPSEVAAVIPDLDAAPPMARMLTIRDPDPGARLTPSELATLRLLAGPDSLPAIARARFVTVNTVKTQVSSIYRRLGVNSRRAAVAEATRRGILGAARD